MSATSPSLFTPIVKKKKIYEQVKDCPTATYRKDKIILQYDKLRS